MARHRRMRVEPLEERRMLAVDFDLLKDINPALLPADFSPESIVELNGVAYFAAVTPANGFELWKSDGTFAGTTLVKDIRPGNSGSMGASAERIDLRRIGDTIFFMANDGTTGYELWKTDGTEAGTLLVKDVRPGLASAIDIFNEDTDFVVVGETLFFKAHDGANGRELWKSDGTEAGTVMVKDIRTFPNTDSVDGFNLLTNVSGTLFFTALDDATGRELWKSDGTEAGTVLVKDIKAGSGGSLGSSFSTYGALTNVGGTLFFRANDGATGYELWKSDGTEAGTVLVKNILSGSANSNVSQLEAVGNILFFYANDGSTGGELWKSDGTTGGTVLVKDRTPGSASSSIAELTNVDGVLYFRGGGLWKSDGTSAGTVLVEPSISPQSLVNIDGALYFSNGGNDLWKSDGTEPGTFAIKDIRPGSSTSATTYIANVAGTVFFSATDGTGQTLWKSDGTEAGTQSVFSLPQQGASGSPLNVTQVGSLVYFVADDGTPGEELWKSDGTEAGTTLVRDLSFINNLTVVNGTLYFIAYHGDYRYEIWKTDGTEAGTVEVSDTGGSITPWLGLENINNTLYFSVNENELWKSDGTTAGTVMVRAFDTSAEYEPYPSSFVEAGGVTYFLVTSGNKGRELWTTDGTTAGTVMVKDINPGPGYSMISSWEAVGSLLYFSANDGTSGSELWKTDGTAAGTVRVKDIRPGSVSSGLLDFENVGGTLYFRATEGVNGLEIWKSDGTEAGTVLVKDIQPGATGSISSPIQRTLTNLNGLLYFTANDGTSGIELWKSDGTEAGTVPVKDIYPGPNSSNAIGIANIDGTLYLTANDGTHGFELWQSDGTEAGTMLAYDFTGDAADGRPGTPMLVNGKLLVGATTFEYGGELWVEDVPPAIPESADFDGDGDVDGRDFLAWQRGYDALSATRATGDADSDDDVDGGDLDVWEEEYGENGLLAVSDQLLAREESRADHFVVPGGGPELGSRLRGNDIREDSYVEQVDRAIEQLATVPSGVRSFGEMVARRGVRRISDLRLRTNT